MQVRGAGVKLDNAKLKGLGFMMGFNLKNGIKGTIHRYVKYRMSN